MYSTYWRQKDNDFISVKNLAEICASLFHETAMRKNWKTEKIAMWCDAVIFLNFALNVRMKQIVSWPYSIAVRTMQLAVCVCELKSLKYCTCVVLYVSSNVVKFVAKCVNYTYTVRMWCSIDVCDSETTVALLVISCLWWQSTYNITVMYCTELAEKPLKRILGRLLLYLLTYRLRFSLQPSSSIFQGQLSLPSLRGR